MKILQCFAACAITTLVSGCINTPPNLLRESSAGIAPSAAHNILVIVNGTAFDAPIFGSQGPAYLSGLGQGTQEALTNIPTKVIRIDAMEFDNQVQQTITAMRPSHVIRLSTVSELSRRGTPISATWQIDVSNVTATPVPAANGRPANTHFTVQPIYRAQADGETCIDTDSLAKKCGTEMGKLLGNAVRAAHVMLLDPGT
ncbi:hypothetical protein [Burkholderia orbicola]|uniref:hypothetical protein n=1 Tax=Burkholderia orbicola TaxID=2978683 RepID=UPI00264DB3AA|nr:hypothetical protein [Burkholderia orbicola]MDN7562286.1 hypothetical protein [Burkholderia orbicola]